MRVTYTQFAEAYARLDPGIDTTLVRARYAAIAAQDGDASTLTERDCELAAAVPPSRPFFLGAQRDLSIVRQVAALLHAERASITRQVEEGSILALLRLTAGQARRLRLLDRAELCELAERMRQEAPRDAFRLASILSDAIVTAARDPRLDAEAKERIISDSCAALLRLSADDVAFALKRCEPRALALLQPQDRALVDALLATIPSSIFDPQQRT